MSRLRPQAAVMPHELETRLASGAVTVTREERLANAFRVLAQPEPYGWIHEEDWPQRPQAIVAFDEELVKYQQAKDRGEKILKDEGVQLRELSNWRAAVCTLEGTLVSSLQLLIGCVHVFEGAGYEDQGLQLRAFIERQFRCHLPVPCPEPWTDWTRRFAEHFAENRSLLPTHLRRMTKPPANHRDALLPAAEQGDLYGA